MNSILNNNNWRVNLGIIIVFLSGVFFQGCNSEETSSMAAEKEIEILSQDDNYLTYLSEFDSYKSSVFSVIENLNDQEKEKLFNNLNNDDYMMSFMEKYDLVVGNIALQKSMLFLEQNEIWMSMTLNEKTALFTRNFKTDAETFTPFARLRSGSESGSECQETFDREVSKAYALAMLDLAVCSCALLPNPMVGCLCYIAVITRYYATIDTLEREKEECERQNP